MPEEKQTGKEIAFEARLTHFTSPIRMSFLRVLGLFLPCDRWIWSYVTNMNTGSGTDWQRSCHGDAERLVFNESTVLQLHHDVL
jgi:hypothetical protein